MYMPSDSVPLSGSVYLETSTMTRLIFLPLEIKREYLWIYVQIFLNFHFDGRCISVVEFLPDLNSLPKQMILAEGCLNVWSCMCVCRRCLFQIFSTRFLSVAWCSEGESAGLICPPETEVLQHGEIWRESFQSMVHIFYITVHIFIMIIVQSTRLCIYKVLYEELIEVNSE